MKVSRFRLDLCQFKNEVDGFVYLTNTNNIFIHRYKVNSENYHKKSDTVELISYEIEDVESGKIHKVC